MDPATWAAVISAIGSALGKAGDLFGHKKDRRLEEKKLKEQKRKTNAELYNASLERSHKSDLKNREERNLLKARQSQALSEMASGFRTSFLGR